MAKLMNLTNGREIASHVEVAESFTSRLVGLLGRSGLPSGHALWIKRCGSVHTFFMRFAIDVVFLDDALVARSVHRNLRPWRITPLRFGSLSAIEFAAGTLDATSVTRGDRLHVGD